MTFHFIYSLHWNFCSFIAFPLFWMYAGAGVARRYPPKYIIYYEIWLSNHDPMLMPDLLFVISPNVKPVYTFSILLASSRQKCSGKQLFSPDFLFYCIFIYFCCLFNIDVKFNSIFHLVFFFFIQCCSIGLD